MIPIAVFAVAVGTLIAMSIMPLGSPIAATTTFSPRLLARVPGTSTVYLVTTNSCVSTFCLGMFRTTSDGGFEARTAPPVTSVRGVATGSLDRLIFANASDGFAVVGENALRLYATTDGVRSWHEVTMPTKSWYDLVVTSNELLVTTDRCTHHRDDCGDFHVWRSTSNGAHWNVLPMLWRTGTGPKDVYYGPSVAAYGHDVWELETGYMAISLWTSHDDGKTFTRALAPRLGSVAGCSFTPFSAVDI